MKGYVFHLSIFLIAFVIGVACSVAFRRKQQPCLKLLPPDAQIQVLDKTTGKVFGVKTCPR